jgi:hypothetical protein
MSAQRFDEQEAQSGHILREWLVKHGQKIGTWLTEDSVGKLKDSIPIALSALQNSHCHIQRVLHPAEFVCKA